MIVIQNYDCHSLPKVKQKYLSQWGEWYVVKVGVAIEMHVNRPIRVTVEIDKRSVCL